MITIFIWLSTIFVCFFSMSRPWIGIVAYYFLAILGPQFIWGWAFDGIRETLIVVVFVFIGIIRSVFNKKYDYSFVKNRTNFFVLTLWISIVISYYFGPYVNSHNVSQLSPEFLLRVTSNICLFYFISTIEMNELKKSKVLAIIMILSVVYLTYWANVQYFTGNWSQFYFGRLMGPIGNYNGSIYRDTNYFAVLFLTGIPFLYYFAFELKKKILRLVLWAIIPFSLHAVFLTGSRGGLVGIVVVAFCILMLSKRKIFIIPLLLFLVIFYNWQAGDVMKKRATKIVNIEGEVSAESRVQAWEGGLKIIMAHPITGVGIGSFETAIPNFIKSRHMVAHNTLIQFAAESGVLAGLSYFFIVVLFFKKSIKISKYCQENSKNEKFKKIKLYNDMITSSFAGFVVCSIFLSLNTSELFFVLLLFNNSLYGICVSNINNKL